MGHFTCVGTMDPQRSHFFHWFILLNTWKWFYCIQRSLHISCIFFIGFNLFYYCTLTSENVYMCCVFVLCSSCGEVVLGGNHKCHHSLQKQILTGVFWVDLTRVYCLLCSVCVLDGFCVMSEDNVWFRLAQPIDKKKNRINDMLCD